MAGETLDLRPAPVPVDAEGTAPAGFRVLSSLSAPGCHMLATMGC